MANKILERAYRRLKLRENASRLKESFDDYDDDDLYLEMAIWNDILEFLRKNPNSTIGDLQDNLNVHSGTLQVQLRSLLVSGQVVRSATKPWTYRVVDEGEEAPEYVPGRRGSGGGGGPTIFDAVIKAIENGANTDRKIFAELENYAISTLMGTIQKLRKSGKIGMGPDGKYIVL